MNIGIFSNITLSQKESEMAIGASENEFIKVAGAQSKPTPVHLYFVLFYLPCEGSAVT